MSDSRPLCSTSVILADYQDRTLRHVMEAEVDLVSEAHVVDEKRDDVESRRNVVGFGAWRDIGFLRNRRRVFVALYSTGQILVLRVGSLQFRWPDNALTVRRVGVFPGIKRFQVLRGRETLLVFTYRYIDQQTWPDNGDIFSYVARAARSPGEVVRTMTYWAAHAAGRDVLNQDFADELERLARDADRREQ